MSLSPAGSSRADGSECQTRAMSVATVSVPHNMASQQPRSLNSLAGLGILSLWPVTPLAVWCAVVLVRVLHCHT